MRLKVTRLYGDEFKISNKRVIYTPIRNELLRETNPTYYHFEARHYFIINLYIK